MSLLYALAEIRTPILDMIQTAISFFGGETFLVIVIALCYWCYDKRLAYRISFAYIIAGTLGQLLKVIFHIPRPWVKDPDFKPVERGLSEATGYSFPSMHSVDIGCLSFSYLFKGKHLWLKIIAVILVIAVPFSRMYLGYHTLQDVLLGLAIAFLITFLVNKFMDSTATDKTQYLKFTFILLIFPLVLLCVSLALYYNEVIDYANMLDAVKSSGGFTAIILSWYFESTYINFNERCDRWWKQLLKAIIGVGIIIGLRFALKSLFGMFGENFWFGDFLRYFLMIGISMGVYPIAIKKFFSAKY